MSSQELSLEELFASPNRWKNVSSYDIVTKYAEAALQNKNTFLNYLQHMFSFNPWVIRVFIMGAPTGVYSIKELFRDELSFLPPEPKYGYGSQTLVQLLNDIDRAYENQTILNSTYRKRILYKASEVLSNDDYKVFSMVINNEFNPKIYEFIEEFYKENNLPEKISKYFLFSFKTAALSTVNTDLFINNTNSAVMYFPSGELSYYLAFNHTCIKLNDKFEKTLEDTNDPLYHKLTSLSKNVIEPIIYIIDDTGIIGYINLDGTFLYTSKKVFTITEHVFSTKLCQGLESALVIDMSPQTPTRKQPRIIGNISYKAGTLQKCTKQVSSFTTTVLPYCGYSASIITCNEKDTNNIFHVFALTEQANKLGKNLKNFKLAELLDRYFYIG